MNAAATGQSGPPFVVRYLTTNGKSKRYRTPSPFALRYRRVNGDQALVIAQALRDFAKAY